MRVIVLGAGLSGLAVATSLRRRGVETVMLERAPAVGGLAKSFRVAGYTFDYGPHFLFGPKVVPILKDLVGPEMELVPIQRRKEKIFLNNKYINFPFDPKNLLKHMETSQVILVLGELLKRKFLGNNENGTARNVEDWVINSVGRRIYEYTSLGEYISKLYGLPPTRVAADWGEQKLKFLARWHQAGLFQLAKGALGEESRLKKQVVHYPPRGIDHLAIKLAGKFLELGGELLLESTVSKIENKNNQLKVYYQHQGEERVVAGDFLISTLPITSLLKMLLPPPPARIMEQAMSLRYRNLLLLFLCLGKEQLLEHQCIYFTEPGSLTRRITEFKHLHPGLAPEGKTSLCVEITHFEEDELPKRGNKGIFDLVLAQLEEKGFLRAAEVESYHLLRIPYAYPVYERDYQLSLEGVLEYLAGHENIISVGRQGLFSYNTMNNCIISGYQLGEKLSVANNWKRSIQETYQQRLGGEESRSSPEKNGGRLTG